MSENNGKKSVCILGIRGIPARHGGFESFAETLAVYLVRQGWMVTVYCQEAAGGEIHTSDWEGVRRIHIPVQRGGALGTVIFDLKAIIHSLSSDGVFLTLGYNTALFNVLHRLTGRTNLFNMDGLEWRRSKWGFIARYWLWLNERCACWLGNHLIADHPEIEAHLATRVSSRKISMIPYGARAIADADEHELETYGLRKNQYALVVARAEPENSILEIVTAFSEKTRNTKLLILGSYHPETSQYHRKVIAAASDEVIFAGAVYQQEKLDSLRFYARFYVHGHQVGGTNPSLVEALGAGNAVLAHDNHFNRWVAGDAAIYFVDAASASVIMDRLFSDIALLEMLRQNAKESYAARFEWQPVLREYEQLLSRWAKKDC